eukprot:scaffold28989_cov133-Isochrysis_galbana.AAC.3
MCLPPPSVSPPHPTGYHAPAEPPEPRSPRQGGVVRGKGFTRTMAVAPVGFARWQQASWPRSHRPVHTTLLAPHTNTSARLGATHSHLPIHTYSSRLSVQTCPLQPAFSHPLVHTRRPRLRTGR